MTGLADDVDDKPVQPKEEEEDDVTLSDPTAEEPRTPPPRPRLQIQPKPLWRRHLLSMLLVALLAWLVLRRGIGKETKPKVIYANRYSNDYKFRPAASPIVTETLKDGRLRVRGAAPTTSKAPEPKPTKTKVKKRRTGKKKKRIAKKKKAVVN
ncbi:hypothetical protein MIND_00296500 [Mycena indigotica]|uniref:Uncharacterized protein n=1 Tax=Mycena indigotica TaxID=2126181 RepID=A0A8H6T2N9_9AGAR|nr:uncharacterized protein MIND_00296500 [Mycena indigotica]KAF7309262.1 hypothetical protein MIND_00296500 [Mycena indigotica]